MSKLLDRILSRENMLDAYNQVKANKGSAGIDGITMEQIDEYLRQNWQITKELIKQRKYKPQPVLRVEIPKPNGGIRQLGIPTVMDRIIQQAIVQVISPICELYFSKTSYGFRPNKSCEKAIIKLLEYLNDGYTWVVDIDLEKFFDTVPQDRLMSLVHNMIQDDPLLLNSHSKVEVSAPSIESILAERAKKNEQLITPEVTPTFTPSAEESNQNTQEIILPTDEVITVGGFE